MADDFARIRSNVQKMIDQNAPTDDIDGYLKTEGYTPEKFKANVGAAATPKGDPVMQGIGAFAHGLTGGGSDELVGGLSWLSQQLGLPNRGGFHEAMQREQGQQAQFAHDNPWTSLGLNAAGTLASAPLMPVARGIAGGMATGAAYGAGSGFLSQNGDIGDRISGAEAGAGAGGVLGGAIPVIASAARASGLAPAASMASSRVLRALGRDSTNVGEVRANVQQAASGGYQHAGIAEAAGSPDLQNAGMNTLGVLRGATASPGPAKNQLNAEYLKRLGGNKFAPGTEGAASRIDAEAASIMGIPKDSFYQDWQDLDQQRRAAAKPAYDAAYGPGEAIWSPELSKLMQTPAVKQAYGHAKELGANEGIQLPQVYDDQGLPRAVPNMQTWDYIKRGLDQVVQDHTKDFGKLDTKGFVVNNVRRQLVEALDKQVPEYAAARQAWSGPTRAMEAMKLGKNVYNFKSGDELGFQLSQRKFSPPEMEYFRRGVAEAIGQRAEAARGAAPDMAQAVAPNDRYGGVLSRAMGANNYVKLRTALSREQRLALSYNKVRGGSDTVAKLGETADLSNMPTSLGGLVSKGVRHTIGHFRNREGVNQSLADMLTPDTQKALKTLQKLEQYEKRKGGLSAILSGVGGRSIGQGLGMLSQ